MLEPENEHIEILLYLLKFSDIFSVAHRRVQRAVTLFKMLFHFFPVPLKIFLNTRSTYVVDCVPRTDVGKRIFTFVSAL